MGALGERKLKRKLFRLKCLRLSLLLDKVKIFVNILKDIVYEKVYDGFRLAEQAISQPDS